MKNNSSILAAFLGAIILISSTEANAQRRWSFELKPGVNFSTKKLGNANLNTGFGSEGVLAYKFMPHLSAYAGWSWNRFSADNSFAGNNIDFEETGYCIGLQFIHPVSTSSIHYMIKGGANFNHIETENTSGKIIDDTGHGWGWQVGTGIALPLGERWMLIPEVRYRSLSRDIDLGDAKTPVDLNYIAVGAGLSFSF